MISKNLENLKNLRFNSSGVWVQQSNAALEALYRNAFCIARSKKPHTTGEEPIKPYFIGATALVLGQNNQASQNKLYLQTIQSKIVFLK